MSRSPLSRLLGTVLALSAGFATPASALAHGHAHGHEAAMHGVAEHTHGDTSAGVHEHDGAEPSTASVGTPSLELPDQQAGEHPHPSVDAAVTTKAATWFLAMVAAHVTLPLARVAVASPPQPEPPLQLRVEAAHAPPPRLRAPPAFIA